MKIVAERTLFLKRNASNTDNQQRQIINFRKLPHTAANFRVAEPSFVAYVIGQILPGGDQELCPCCNSSYDDRLYQFPVRKTFCGDKPNWDESKPPSEEDQMIMEITGWSKEQLYAGMKEVQTMLTFHYYLFMIIRCAGPMIFLFYIMILLSPFF
ncbi:Oidioi.mRNA.OKI2018_I69.chr1.g47.t1.cds [Oikopleura dioica]|uniref:Oidioi.mRNA.OKI2018_I69.chr1.g47.t1.cds n=1 Tax=Oikopleura dioica TaxID=34765 RepID=A0ABN7SMD1_OIKDI|nr:Oidioi.mRNA.OKI2018_I69.chr1.g47.t1.cds [Oikopleura dioica]